MVKLSQSNNSSRVNKLKKFVENENLFEAWLLLRTRTQISYTNLTIWIDLIMKKLSIDPRSHDH